MHCYHGLCCLSLKGSLLVCDDENQIIQLLLLTD